MKFFDAFSSEKKKGSLGEKEIGREFGIHSVLGKHGKIHKNLYVPAAGNKTSEIDLIFLCQKEFLSLKVRMSPDPFMAANGRKTGPFFYPEVINIPFIIRSDKI